MKINVHMLGTGSPRLNKNRCSSGTLVQVGGEKLLLDCGYGTVRRLVEADVVPADIHHLFFTHHHYDHNVDYPAFVLYGGHGGSIPLDVYGPVGTEKLTHDLFEAGFAIDIDNRLSGIVRSFERFRDGAIDRRQFEHELAETKRLPVGHDIDAGFVLERNDFRLIVQRADHFTAGGNFSLCFRVETSSGSVAFSGDTLPCDGVRQIAAGADVLVHEVLWQPQDATNGRLPFRASDVSEERYRSSRLTKHSLPEEVAQVAKEAGVKKLVLTHFFSDARLDELGNWMRCELDIEVMVASDNLRFSVC